MINFGVKMDDKPGYPTEQKCNCIREELKTCGRCVHDGESADIVGSSCYLCKRNPEDHRIDWFEEKKEESKDA